MCTCRNVYGYTHTLSFRSSRQGHKTLIRNSLYSSLLGQSHSRNQMDAGAKEQGLLVENKRGKCSQPGRLGIAGESGECGANQGRLRLGGKWDQPREVGEPTKGGYDSIGLRTGFLSAKTRKG